MAKLDMPPRRSSGTFSMLDTQHAAVLHAGRVIERRDATGMSDGD
jgi:hypothetical protein